MFKFLKNYFKKEVQEVQETQEEKENKVLLFKKDILKLNNRADTIIKKNFDIEYKKYKTQNSVCSVCSSKNIINKITRIQGDIKSSNSLDYNSGFLGVFSEISSKSNFDAKIDTNEILHCNDCGNEWKKASYPDIIYNKVFIYKQIDHLRFYLYELFEITNCKYDPLDSKEEFFSLEEKLNHIKQKAWWTKGFGKQEIINFWQGINLSTLNELLKNDTYVSDYEKKLFKKVFDKKELLNLGFLDN